MPSKDQKKLDQSILKLKRVLAIRDVVEKFVAEYNHERDANQVSVRLESLDKINKEFHHAQGEMEMIDSDHFEEHIEVRTAFENRYCVLKGFLLSKQKSNQPMMTMIGSFGQQSAASFHHRLPKIDLPKFSGDESRWISFRDNFISMIHSNDDIPTVNKLHYLLQSLEEEAKKPFESVDIQADNYASTWDALLKRYDNKRFLKRTVSRLVRSTSNEQGIRRRSQHISRRVSASCEGSGQAGEPVIHWDTPLIFILSKKLDASTLRAWEHETRQKDEVRYDELIDFLSQHIRMLKSVASDLQQRSLSTSIKVAGPSTKKTPAFKSVANPATAEVISNVQLCPACSQNHQLHQCPTFNELSISQRRELVVQRSLCRNCFRLGHQARVCRSRFSCRTCQARHHTMLHENVAVSNSTTTPIETSTISAQQPNLSTPVIAGTSGSAHPPEVSMAIQSKHSTVLLETVSLFIVDYNGRRFPVRALLDSASMSNFITKKLANDLGIRRTSVDVTVAGLGESVKKVKRQITATIESKTSSFSTTLEFLVMRKPTASLPTVLINTAAWNMPNVRLADPHFNIPSMIDIIIGGECYHEIHTGSRLSIGDGLPLLVDTRFGWTVSGKTTTNPTVAPPVCYLSTVDPVDQSPIYSEEEKQCEEFYATTTTRTHDGRYVVRLPRSDNPQVTLGQSRQIATRRFYSLERRLERDTALKSSYHNFIEEYLRLGHMRKLDFVDDDSPHCYLPHHPVVKESSTTTKLRVVFDASCKTSSGMSLNDTLLVGPVVQQNLDSIIIRFRFHAIAIVADVEKMYRQILHSPVDQRFLRILFRRQPSDPLDTYELLTVTYGTASAPFLATRTLQQLARDEGENSPKAVEAVVEDFYVDDLLTGEDNLASAVENIKK
ncbi:uncharacterized protein LOC134203540 [Armigeres subalbatus]|uniref:uncharacterized protein LOC134203540 n=1 Tax=Armigeres subalbatus TaxID=124917 RepID=UPI002ED1DE8D